MSLKKIDYIDQETVIEAENLNDIQDSIIALEETSPDAIVNTASGEAIAISDSSAKKLAGLNIYGKSTQAGTPTPAAPVDIVSVGDDGDIVVTVGTDMLALTLQNALRGVPVTNKALATYTDPDGQMWCADEIDFARGVYIKRVGIKVFKGTESGWWKQPGERLYRIDWSAVTGGWSKKYALASHFTYNADKAYIAEAGYFAIDSAGSCYFACDKETLAEFGSWLATNNVTVICPLVTPVETPLTAEDIAAYKALHTNKPNTTIINDENAYMTVKYIADPKSYIDNKVASAILAATVE